MSKRFDNENQRGKRRRFCGSCKLFCLAFLVVVGLAIYFVMPSAPSVTVGDVYIPANSQGLLINGNPVSDYSATMILTSPITQVSYEFAINITIYSPSYIDIGFRKTSLRDSDNQVIQNLWANSTLTHLDFPPRKSTVIPVPLYMTMISNNQDSLLSNPAFATFVEQCGATGSKKLNSTITVLFDIGAFAWLNYYPSFSFEKAVDCPEISQMNGRFAIEAPFISDSSKTLEEIDEDEITPIKKIKDTRVSSYNGLIYFDDSKYDNLERQDSVNLNYKKYCCVFESKQNCVRSVLLALFLFVLSLIIVGIILYPKIPKIDIEAPYVLNPSNALHVNFSPKGLDSITLQIAVDYTVHSENYYNVFVSKITTRLDLSYFDFTPCNNSYGDGVLRNTNYPGKTATKYTMPILITYKYDDHGTHNDPTLFVINNTILAESTKPVYISYAVDIDIPVLSWTGYIISKTGEMSFGLHDLPPDERKAVLSKLKSVFALLG
ncbi:hypothetical protein HDV06_000161 [Boothiomyces sp. JEL0866]|nr:hypothetical protein HDV06_000161 [Boothiomyces sp. JEL0866]